MRDLHNKTQAVNAFSAATIATNTTTAGVTVDCQGYDAVELIARAGAWTDGSYALSITESDASGTGFTAAPAASVLGAGQSIGAANTVKKLGYVGSKRYIRLSIVSTGVTSGASLSAVALLDRGRHTGGQAV
jgi:hypothetical protein